MVMPVAREQFTKEDYEKEENAILRWIEHERVRNELRKLDQNIKELKEALDEEEDEEE